MKPTPKQIVKRIIKLYEMEFGSKERGRFFIPAELFRRLADRRRIEDSFKDQVINEAYENDLVITDHSDGYSIIEEKVMTNYRRVTKGVIEEVLKKAKNKKK
ncbi:MAG: hypothetical protein PHS57_03005 [Alphaproteobacteria bacterium]|nr:hypothetical protein [Alphaproteobacteria bacterium]